VIRVSVDRFQMIIFEKVHSLTANERFGVNASFDSKKAGQLLLTVQFNDQNIQWDEELIALVIQKLKEACKCNGNGNNRS
jgi:hypothetical protein